MRLLTQTGVWIICPENQATYYSASFIEVAGDFLNGKAECALYMESGDRVKDVNNYDEGYLHEISVEDIINDAVPATIDQTYEIRAITWAKEDCVSDAEKLEEDE